MHADVAARSCRPRWRRCATAGVTVHGDERVASYGAAAGVAFEPVTEEDWAREYLSLDIAAGVVDSVDDAIAHIRR